MLEYKVYNGYVARMSKTNVVTARLDPEVLSRLDRLAEYQERSRSWLVAKAVERFVSEEAAFLDFIQEGEDAIDRGDYLTQDEMERWFEARITARNERKSAAG